MQKGKNAHSVGRLPCNQSNLFFKILMMSEHWPETKPLRLSNMSGFRVAFINSVEVLTADIKC